MCETDVDPFSVWLRQPNEVRFEVWLRTRLLKSRLVAYTKKYTVQQLADMQGCLTDRNNSECDTRRLMAVHIAHGSFLIALPSSDLSPFNTRRYERTNWQAYAEYSEDLYQ